MFLSKLPDSSLRFAAGAWAPSHMTQLESHSCGLHSWLSKAALMRITDEYVEVVEHICLKEFLTKFACKQTNRRTDEQTQ